MTILVQDSPAETPFTHSRGVCAHPQRHNAPHYESILLPILFSSKPTGIEHGPSWQKCPCTHHNDQFIDSNAEPNFKFMKKKMAQSWSELL